MYVVSAADPDNIILQPAESATRLAKLMDLIETKYKGKPGAKILSLHVTFQDFRGWSVVSES